MTDRHFAWVLAALFVLRSAYLWVNGLDLLGDESYYWDWSRRPDWCYYSKPPMVAWLIALATALGGDTTVVVRWPAVALGTGTLAYLYATAKAVYGLRAAWLAVLLMLATPANVLANLLITIDAPLLCFWMASVYYLHQALFSGQQQAWVYAGIATGLALLSKQAALLLPFMLVGYLLLCRQRPAQWRYGLLCYFLPVLVCLAPLLWWNHQHHWVMLGHSQSHFAAKAGGTWEKHLSQGAEYWLFQGILLSPLLFGLWFGISVQKLRRWRLLAAKEQFLLSFGPVVALAMLALSWMQKVQGNWALPFYLCGWIMLAGCWQAGQWRRGFKYAVALGLGLVVVTYTLPMVMPLTPWADSRLDITARLKHWQNLALAVDSQRQVLQIYHPDLFVLTVGHRYLASELAFYLPDHPQVVRYETNGQIVSQYELWPGTEQHLGQTALIVAKTPDLHLLHELAPVFQSIRQVGQIPAPLADGGDIYLFLGETLLFWPPPCYGAAEQIPKKAR